MLALDPVARSSTAASACPLSSALGSHARSRKATSKLDGRRVCGAAGCLRSASRVNEWLACSRNIASLLLDYPLPPLNHASISHPLIVASRTPSGAQPGQLVHGPLAPRRHLGRVVECGRQRLELGLLGQLTQLVPGDRPRPRRRVQPVVPQAVPRPDRRAGRSTRHRPRAGRHCSHPGTAELLVDGRACPTVPLPPGPPLAPATSGPRLVLPSARTWTRSRPLRLGSGYLVAVGLYTGRRRRRGGPASSLHRLAPPEARPCLARPTPRPAHLPPGHASVCHLSVRRLVHLGRPAPRGRLERAGQARGARVVHRRVPLEEERRPARGQGEGAVRGGSCCSRGGGDARRLAPLLVRQPGPCTFGFDLLARLRRRRRWQELGDLHLAEPSRRHCGNEGRAPQGGGETREHDLRVLHPRALRRQEGAGRAYAADPPLARARGRGSGCGGVRWILGRRSRRSGLCTPLLLSTRFARPQCAVPVSDSETGSSARWSMTSSSFQPLSSSAAAYTAL